MLYGGFDNQMQIMGLIVILQNQESTNPSLSRTDVRQQMTNAIKSGLRTAFRGRAEIRAQVVALANANQLLEARVLELERQVTAVMATRP